MSLNTLFAPIKCHKGRLGCQKKTTKTHGRCSACQREYQRKKVINGPARTK